MENLLKIIANSEKYFEFSFDILTVLCSEVTVYTVRFLTFFVKQVLRRAGRCAGLIVLLLWFAICLEYLHLLVVIL